MPRGQYAHRPAFRLPGAPKAARKALVAAFMRGDMVTYGNAAEALREWCIAHPIDLRLLDRNDPRRVDLALGAVPRIEADDKAPRLPRDVAHPGGRRVAVLDYSQHAKVRDADDRRKAHRKMKRRLAQREQERHDQNAPTRT